MEADAWTVESYTHLHGEALRLVDDLESLSETMQHHIDTLKHVRKNQKSENATARRKAMVANSQKLAPLRGQSFPRTLTTWFSEDVCGGFGEQDVDNSFVQNHLPEGDAHTPDAMRFWPKDSDEPVVSAFRAFVTSFISKTKTPIDSMFKLLSKPDTKVSILQTWLGVYKVGKSKSVEFPAVDDEQGVKPFATATHIQSFGSPFIVTAAPYGFRWSTDEWRFAGVGCFLHGLRGRCVVISWPMDRVIQAKTRFDDEKKYLEGMAGGAKAVRTYIKQTAHWCSVGIAATVWVPFGHHVWIVGEDVQSALLAQPCFDKGLMEGLAADVKMGIVESIKGHLQERLDKEPVKHFHSCLTAFLSEIASS